LFAIQWISGPTQASVTELKQQKPRTLTFPNIRIMAAPKGLRISAELSLNTYTGSDRDSLDINGELSKLAFNISLGHGIHAGIHFRSSTFWSVLLGEQVALSILRDRAKSYAEPFTITITKFDGTSAEISNE
jgi:hypothetical protein